MKPPLPWKISGCAPGTNLKQTVTNVTLKTLMLSASIFPTNLQQYQPNRTYGQEKHICKNNTQYCIYEILRNLAM